MSKKSRQIRAQNGAAGNLRLNEKSSEARKTAIAIPEHPINPGLFTKLKRHWWMVGIIALLSLGTLGAGLKYLDDDAKREMTKRNASTPLNPVKDESMLNSINPFITAPSPTPTPQLSKEYIYAGSRLLAVEDANANAASPADLAFWRPLNGTWYVMGAGGTLQTSLTWGTNGDKPVPGDFDGDGKTDFAVYRSTTGAWFIVKSSSQTGEWYAASFGQSGDIPAQADYDGDGKTDLAVFRPSAGMWYIQRSSDAGVTFQAFGLSTDKPAPADYDGDGRADIGVWRNADTTFYSLNSSNNALGTAAIGQSGSEPVSADYDGDGHADYAVRSGANWIIRKSSNNQTETTPWQQSSDLAVHNDYDGDGKVDIGVFRAAASSPGAGDAGRWYIRQSSRIGQTNELRQETWGQAGDIPVPAFYRR